MRHVLQRTRTTLKRFLPLMLVFGLLGIGVIPATTPRAYATTTATPVYIETMNGISVNICSNDHVESDGTKDGNLTTCGGQTHVGGDITDPDSIWQCVEFLQRFYTDENWHSGIFPHVDVAADIWTYAGKSPADGGMGMSEQPNTQITSIVPGDMIVHGVKDGYSVGAGHVAVVDHMSADGTKVYAVQQNAPSITMYSLSKDTSGNGTLTGGSGSDIKGIVHSPSNHNTGSGGAANANPRAIVLDSAGNLSVKEGALNVPWVLVDQGVVAYDASPNRIAALDTSGNLFVKDGPIGAVWVQVATGVSPGNFHVTDDMIAVLWGTSLYTKVGSIGGTWGLTLNPVQSFKVSADDHIAALMTDGSLAVQWGLVGSGWTSITNSINSYGITDDMVNVTWGSDLCDKFGSIGATWALIVNPVASFKVSSGDHIAAVFTDGTLAIQWGPVGTGWVVETSGVDAYALTDNRLGILQSGTLSIKEGSAGAIWSQVATGIVSFMLT